jgi:hypothetical protein
MNSMKLHGNSSRSGRSPLGGYTNCVSGLNDLAEGADLVESQALLQTAGQYELEEASWLRSQEKTGRGRASIV